MVNRLYVIAYTHEQYMNWCRQNGVNPRGRGIVEVGPWNYYRALLGTRNAPYLLLDSWDEAPSMPNLSFELTSRQAKELTEPAALEYLASLPV
jgi:hypothetical protein